MCPHKACVLVTYWHDSWRIKRLCAAQAVSMLFFNYIRHVRGVFVNWDKFEPVWKGVSSNQNFQDSRSTKRNTSI